MTNTNISSTDTSATNECDLVQPDRAVASMNRGSNESNQLPLPEISDTGRISFGASCRILRSGM